MSAGITGHLKRRNSNEKRTHPDHDLPVVHRRHPLRPDRKPAADEGQHPFSFTVDSQTLPPGQYYVLSVTPERSIRLASIDGKHSATVNDLPNYATSPSPNSRLVFHKYGNEYFLAQVWTAGDNVARNPFISQRAMEIAHSGSQPDTKIILAYAAH